MPTLPKVSDPLPETHLFLCPPPPPPAMIMAGALLPLSVSPYFTYVRLSRRRPLSKSNTFDQNFMKLCHIL